MQLVPVIAENEATDHNLIQCDEAEFSSLTGNQPDAGGRFALKTVLGGRVFALPAMVDAIPAGLAAIAEPSDAHFEVCEFDVVQCFRGAHFGQDFAHALWMACLGMGHPPNLPDRRRIR